MRSKAFLSASVIVFIGLGIAGCNWLNSLTKFPINYSSDFTIPQGIPANIPYDIYTPKFATNSSKYFKDNNTSTDLIQGCTVKSLQGTVVEPSAEDFSFINSIRIFLIGKDLPQAELAYRNDIPDNIGDTLNFNIQNVELLEYIKKDSLSLRVQVFTDRVNTAALNTKLKVQFIVDAKILGI
jgi:hypothetical protein